MGSVIGSIGRDPRCSVHQCVLGIREGKEGWFHVICPSSAACSDDGSLWASIVSCSLLLPIFCFRPVPNPSVWGTLKRQLQTLLDCCCRRKAFLASMTKLVGALQLLALRDHSSAQEVLCLMLEWGLLETATGPAGSDEPGCVESALPLQVATTLQSTESGRRRYFELCDRQLHLKELVGNNDERSFVSWKMDEKLGNANLSHDLVGISSSLPKVALLIHVEND